MNLIKKYSIKHINYKYFCVSDILINICKMKIRPTAFLNNYGFKRDYDYKKINNKLYMNTKAIKIFFKRCRYRLPNDIMKFLNLKEDNYKLIC